MTEPARTLASLNADMLAGHHVGAQVFAAIDGETVIDLAVGEAATEIPMTVSTIVEWASATKALTATAIGLLWERGLIDPDDPVARHVPEFSENEKEAVTIRHRLTHTSGMLDRNSRRVIRHGSSPPGNHPGISAVRHPRMGNVAASHGRLPWSDSRSRSLLFGNDGREHRECSDPRRNVPAPAEGCS